MLQNLYKFAHVTSLVAMKVLLLCANKFFKVTLLYRSNLSNMSFTCKRMCILSLIFVSKLFYCVVIWILFILSVTGL